MRFSNIKLTQPNSLCSTGILNFGCLGSNVSDLDLGLDQYSIPLGPDCSIPDFRTRLLDPVVSREDQWQWNAEISEKNLVVQGKAIYFVIAAQRDEWQDKCLLGMWEQKHNTGMSLPGLLWDTLLCKPLALGCYLDVVLSKQVYQCSSFNVCNYFMNWLFTKKIYCSWDKCLIQ